LACRLLGGHRRGRAVRQGQQHRRQLLSFDHLDAHEFREGRTGRVGRAINADHIEWQDARAQWGRCAAGQDRRRQEH
jgi:hypothetical protein